MPNFQQQLQQLGFSQKEAAVYLAALELGSASVQMISEKAGVNRATTYLMIESLSNRGLISAFIKEKKRLYAAESPERLISMIRLQRQTLEARESEVLVFLPSLLALHKTHDTKPQIRYLEGEEGLRTMREMFFKLQGEFVQIVPFDQVKKHQTIQQTKQEHHERIEKNAVPHRALIFVKESDTGKIKRLPGGEVRFVSDQLFPIQSEITIREDHVLIVSYTEKLLSVVIVSQEIADSLRALFELGWKGAE